MAIMVLCAWCFFGSVCRAQGGPVQAWILWNASTGQSILAYHPDVPIHPASMTKLMTMEIVFSLLDAHVIHPQTLLPMTLDGAARPNTKLGVPAGSLISVRDALLAMAVHSSNDVATAVADFIAGNEGRFAQAMTTRAHAMGLQATHFTSASGLPDPDNLSTVRNIALLGNRIWRDHPQDWGYLGVPQWAYGPRVFYNTNTLLGLFPGMDAGKTGYVRASGFNLFSSVTNGKTRWMAVVVGAPSAEAAEARTIWLYKQVMPVPWGVGAGLR